MPRAHCPGCDLINDRYAAVDAHPGEHCRFAVVSSRSAAKFALVAGERSKLRQLLKFGLLEPAPAAALSSDG
jgi:hypothetical protein